jgi:hypothetical protein
MALNITVFEVLGNDVVYVDLGRAIEDAFQRGYRLRSDLDEEIRINGEFTDASNKEYLLIGEEENLEWNIQW